MPKYLKFLAALLVSYCLCLGAPAQANQDLSWVPDDGEELSFKVLRNGKKFGYHNVKFEVDDDTITVTNDIKLTAGFGPVTVYSYRHSSAEIWRDGKLISMVGETKKDGDKLTMKALWSDGTLTVNGTGYSGDVPATIVPSSHWNIREVQSDKILSSENGEVLDVKIDNLGKETLTINGKKVQTTRYKLKSSLSADLWYDSSGRWVKCAFKVRDQNIEYVLQ